MSASILLRTAVLALAVLAGCSSLEKSAAKDPQKCERYPECVKKSRAYDCSRQCADDPACVDRCREVQLATGASGR
jgi:hypothetical protein